MPPSNASTGTDTPAYNSSQYGDGYGTEWIYFPDGDGTPHNVSLTGIGEEWLPQLRGGFNELEYRLFIRNNLTDSILLNESAEPVLQIDEDINLSMLPLKVITHGWRSSVESDAVAKIRDAYLAKKNVNVVTIDWSYIANSIFYHWVANQTETIGMEITTFLNALSTRYNVSGDQVHLIGHSLGAHIMGIAAFHSNLSVDRITGMDPARPLFEYPSRDDPAKLDSKDARFVDIIHTCAGVLGIESNVGTVDFYPNKACSHGRSYYYFAESIANPKAFPSYQCNNWTEYLGQRCDRSVFMGEE
ncbi:Vitellogenin-1, partial [Operophtera brumata]